MGITLTSKAINSTYDSLLKLSDNDQLTGAFKVITDGLGNDTGISINNTNQVNIAGQLVVNSSITANSFVRSGGLSSQFLKADGSVDSNTYQSVHQKGLANGYAPLDGGAKISEAYLPDSIVGQLEYQGTWNATTNTPTLPSASTVKGHYYVTSVAGTYQTIEYAIGDWVISNGTSWEKVDNTDAVTTVFGRIGAIVANSNDYSDFYHPKDGDLAANASTATTLQTARFINGTSFNGSASITTAIWGASRTITIGDTGKSLNGSTNVTWSRAELGITKANIDALNVNADTLDGIDSTGFVKQLGITTSPNYQTPSSSRVNPSAFNPTNEHYAITTFGNNGNVTGQLATHFVYGDLYSRAYNSNWSNWKKYWNDTDFTSVNVSNWNTAYGWGDWSTGVNKAFVDALNVDADTLDNLNSTQFLRSDTSDTMSGTLTVANDIIIKRGDVTYKQAYHSLYVGGDSLDGANTAIYIGNRGDGTGYGYELFYEGVGSGNNNKLKLISENLGTPKVAFEVTADGDVTFPNNLVVEGSINLNAASLSIGASNIIFDTESTLAVRGLIWDVDGGFKSKIDGGGTNGGLVEIYTNLDGAITTGDVFRIKQGSSASTAFSMAGNGYVNIPNRLAIGKTTAPNAALDVSTSGAASIISSSQSLALDVRGGNNGYNLAEFKTTTNAVGASIMFSDHSASDYLQRGNISYYHADGDSYGSENAFVIGGNQNTTTILADGKLMFKEGIYSKPSSGTGAGIRKDINWDNAYSYSQIGHLPLTGGTLTGGLNVASGILDIGQNRIDGSSDNLKISADNSNVSGSSTIEFLVDGSEKMRINNGGNVGIGTTSPDRQLEIYGVNDAYMKFDGGRAGNHGYTIGSDSSGFIIYDDTLGSYRFVIDQDSGNVGIGTTSPATKLDVSGGILASGNIATSSGNISAGSGYMSANEYKLASSANNGRFNAVSEWGTRHYTDNGYIQFGPANDSHAHIYTDRPSFYLNKEILINGNTVWNAGNDGSGSGLDADLLDGIDSTGFVKQLSEVGSPDYTTPSSRRVNPNASNPTSEHYAVTTFGNDGNVTGQLATHFVSGLPYTRAFNSGWSAWRKIWTDANDGSGSGLDADLLDGQQGSYYAQASLINTNIKYLGTGVSYDINRTTKVPDGIALYSAYSTGSNSPHSYDFSAQFVGSSRGFELSAAWHLRPRLQIRTLRDCCDNWSSFYDVAIHGLNNGAGALYATGLYDSDNTGYYLDPAGTSNLNALKVNSIYLDRDEAASRGISWYSSSYRAWSEYMSPSGATGCGATANITAPSGAIVTSWAQRTFIENAGNYGWTWESGTATGQPSVVAEIRSSDGLAQFNGGVRSPIFYDSDNTGYYLNPAGTSNINELWGSGKQILTTSDSYLRINESASFSSGIWFGQSNRLSDSNTYIAAGGNGGTTSSKVYIFGGAYTGTNVIKIDGNSGIIQTTTDSMRAPIFYDYNNTGYYTNPASTSNLNQLDVVTLNVSGTLTGTASGNLTNGSSEHLTYVHRIHAGDGTSPDNLGFGNRYNTFNYGVSSGVTGPLLSFGALGDAYPMQITGTYSGGSLFKVRTRNGDTATWNAWRTLWHDGNDGSGSGLDADLLDGLDSSRFVYGGEARKSNQVSVFANSNEPSGFYFGSNVANAPTTDWINYMHSVGNSWSSSNNYSFQLTHAFHSDNLWVSRTTNGSQAAARLILDSGSSNQTKTGYIQSNDSLRAPIFYDSDNTSYYLDPASTGLSAKLAGNLEVYARSAAWSEGIRVRVPTTNTWGGVRWTRDRANYDGNWALGFKGAGDTTDDLVFWANNAGGEADKARIDKAGNFTAVSSSRAPIFYDSDNTGYYVDPAGISNLSQSKFLAGISVNSGSSSATKHGISLYGTQTTGMPAYGLAFTGTAGEGTHGSVTSDWATYFTMSGSTSRGWIFKHQTNRVASISGTGNASFNGDVIAYFSDMRLKTKLGNIENPIQKIQSLNGFYYEPNEVAESYGYKKERKLGLSAQEVEAILPEIVTDAPIGDGYKTVDYAKLVPVLIEAIKEQQKQIDELKQLINK